MPKPALNMELLKEILSAFAESTADPSKSLIKKLAALSGESEQNAQLLYGDLSAQSAGNVIPFTSG